jgi:hypothetical protein
MAQESHHRFLRDQAERQPRRLLHDFQLELGLGPEDDAEQVIPKERQFEKHLP